MSFRNFFSPAVWAEQGLQALQREPETDVWVPELKPQLESCFWSCPHHDHQVLVMGTGTAERALQLPTGVAAGVLLPATQAAGLQPSVQSLCEAKKCRKKYVTHRLHCIFVDVISSPWMFHSKAQTTFSNWTNPVEIILTGTWLMSFFRASRRPWIDASCKGDQSETKSVYERKTGKCLTIPWTVSSVYFTSTVWPSNPLL